MPTRIKGRGKPVLTKGQLEALAALRSDGHIITDRVTPIQGYYNQHLTIRRSTMQRLETLGYVRQDHDHYTVNGSEVWHYTITLAGLEALREA
jgi:hypothetical protein